MYDHVFVSQFSFARLSISYPKLFGTTSVMQNNPQPELSQAKDINTNLYYCPFLV